MPHLPASQQALHGLPLLADVLPADGADLNYAITKLVDNMLADRIRINGGYRYADLEEIAGALTGALHEFEALVVRPYEDRKIAENGCAYSSAVMDYARQGAAQADELPGE